MYSCRVFAGNSFGYGEGSSAVEFKTVETGQFVCSATHLCSNQLSCFLFVVPSAPPRVESAVAESSSLISLYWLPPLSIHINGELQHYVVNVTESNTGKKWTFLAVDTVLRLGSLHPDYVYEFTLTAHTIGNGPYSPAATVRTEEDGKVYFFFWDKILEVEGLFELLFKFVSS